MRLQGFVKNTTRFTEAHNKDCVPRALAAVTGLDYNLVREFLSLKGRRSDATGFDIRGLISEYRNELLGKQFLPTRELSLSGKFLCSNHSHAWAIVNGKLYDSSAGGRRAKFIWKIVDNPDGDSSESVIAKAKLKLALYDLD